MIPSEKNEVEAVEINQPEGDTDSEDSNDDDSDNQNDNNNDDPQGQGQNLDEGQGEDPSDGEDGEFTGEDAGDMQPEGEGEDGQGNTDQDSYDNQNDTTTHDFLVYQPEGISQADSIAEQGNLLDAANSPAELVQVSVSEKDFYNDRETARNQGKTQSISEGQKKVDTQNDSDHQSEGNKKEQQIRIRPQSEKQVLSEIKSEEQDYYNDRQTARNEGNVQMSTVQDNDQKSNEQDQKGKQQSEGKNSQSKASQNKAIRIRN